MIHHSVGASRGIVQIIAAVGGPLLAIISGGLSTPASAGGGSALGPEPSLRGSYCGGSGQVLAAPARAGCARINGYIAADDRFGSDGRIGGRPDPFAPLDERGIGGGVSGFKTVGAPLGGSLVLPLASPGRQLR